jgi:hypothetical protein
VLSAHTSQEIERQIQLIVKSVKFELSYAKSEVRLAGPDVSYHRADPWLPTALRKLDARLRLENIPGFQTSREHYDLCLEDSWTGYFMAQQLKRWKKPHDILFIHLDDHMDMMPTLLHRQRALLVNPANGARFDPTSARDWKTAMRSGAVSIGNFITPMFYSGWRLHIRHIHNNATANESTRYVSLDDRRYDLIPGKRFAAVAQSTQAGPKNVGTYQGGTDAHSVLTDAPSGHAFVHIDLDYFINDLNGAPVSKQAVDDRRLRRVAEQKMDRFFDCLRETNPGIRRWMIAASPGFCSARHWNWLLARLERRIHAFEKARQKYE